MNEGFAPALDGTEDALDSIMAAIKAAGYEPGKDVKIGMDCASSEFYKNGVYDYTIFEGEKGKKRTADEQIDYMEYLINKYPIDSIEDGMSENDWDGWKKLTERISDRCQLVGDDLFVTNVEFLAKGIAMAVPILSSLKSTRSARSAKRWMLSKWLTATAIPRLLPTAPVKRKTLLLPTSP